MAHFAKINTDNIVVDVVVVKDSEILIDGAENEQKGVEPVKKSLLVPQF